MDKTKGQPQTTAALLALATYKLRFTALSEVEYDRAARECWALEVRAAR